MKNNLGIIIGFAMGTAGFLFLFKIIILNNTSPADELAPGMVVIASILSGIVFAFAGNYIQKRYTKSI